MRPITKWNARLSDAAIIPEVVRKAFKLAEGEKPGATHIELPEDVMVQRDRRQPAAAQPPGALRAGRARAAPRRRPDPRRDHPRGARRQRRRARQRRAGAARVRARHRHPRRRDVHGQGPDPARQRQGARLGRAPVGRLQHGRLRRGRPRARDRLRPRRALAGALEPAARQADHLHRLDPGRDRRVLHPRGRADRRHLPRAHAARRGVPPRAAPGRLDAPARRGAGPLRAGQGRRRLPRAAAARALRDPQGARARGHPDLGRRAAQAVDRAHVPGLRAEHGADRQRARRDGLRGARGRRRRSSCTPTATS